MCSANEAEACTLPPDVRTLTDLMRANIFTPTAARSWCIVANHLFLASRPIMNHYPTDLIPVYFRTKRIALENVTQWFVVHGGRDDTARLGTTLAEHPMTPIRDSPTGVDENIPLWNWTVNDNFKIAHGSASTPLPIVPPPLTAEE
ncbi:hypothetical protein DAEQUDRAFT_766679 [Daedalea quercina L-15889]|uniref:Uncharacterized protein n=1 Tax=Daedalea quercina L-15889 TaxID=1314783 RepID=A0A165PEH8_9APHY|nr:hypothetical protein DAEQUDRAFT_766679 [Daedalea quercina L-15889]